VTLAASRRNGDRCARRLRESQQIYNSRSDIEIFAQERQLARRSESG
jgi:hypothetical protein